MTPLDPIDLSSSAPFDPISYYVHIIIGTVALLAALVALSVRKGGKTHILAGRVFSICIVIVCVTSLVMLLDRMAPPLLVATVTAVYCIGTALLALKPISLGVKIGEIGLAVLQIVAVVIFLSMALPQVYQGNIPPIAPIVICVIPVILLLGDINYFKRSEIRQNLRVRRHLSRMIWAVVVSVRAPLVEVNGTLNIPVPIILFAPIIVTPIVIWWVLKKYPIRTSSSVG